MVSLVVFGGLILFAAYAMVHFVHEWREARERRAATEDETPSDDP